MQLTQTSSSWIGRLTCNTGETMNTICHAGEQQTPYFSHSQAAGDDLIRHVRVVEVMIPLHLSPLRILHSDESPN